VSDPYQELRARCLPQLEAEEAVRLKLYTDTVGKQTIGIGRNLNDVGVSLDEALYLAGNDVTRALNSLEKYGWFTQLSLVRQAALVSMMFNLGPEHFAGFHMMIAAIEMNDWHGAAEQMLSSRWAIQVGTRASRIAQMMRDDSWPTDINYAGI
jgi:lysozyme